MMAILYQGINAVFNISKCILALYLQSSLANFVLYLSMANKACHQNVTCMYILIATTVLSVVFNIALL